MCQFICLAQGNGFLITNTIDLRFLLSSKAFFESLYSSQKVVCSLRHSSERFSDNSSEVVSHLSKRLYICYSTCKVCFYLSQYILVHVQYILVHVQYILVLMTSSSCYSYQSCYDVILIIFRQSVCPTALTNRISHYEKSVHLTVLTSHTSCAPYSAFASTSNVYCMTITLFIMLLLREQIILKIST